MNGMTWVLLAPLLHFTAFMDVAQDQGSHDPGTLDHSFNPGSPINGTVLATAIQPDGNLVIAGDFTSVNGAIRNRVARMNSDGTLDKTFDPGLGADAQIESIALQVDGRILIAGRFTNVGNVNRAKIARLNRDGSLDLGFNAELGLRDYVTTVVLQTDGRVILGGDFNTVNGVTCNYVARLHSDGSLDRTFEIGSGANSAVNSIVVDPEGRVLIAGNFTSMNGVIRNRIARFNADGSIDSDFDPKGGPNGTVRSLALLPDGRMMLGGSFDIVSGQLHNGAARLNSDGSLDPSFRDTRAGGEVFSVAVQPDGKVLLGGSFYGIANSSRQTIARLNADGSLDPSFDAGGVGLWIYSVVLQSDGRIVVGGDFSRINGRVTHRRLARLNPDGTVDGDFQPLSGPNGRIYSLASQPDGKILIAGAFSSVDAIDRSLVARLNSDGSLDRAFEAHVTHPTESYDSGGRSRVGVMLVQPDGRIVIVGEFKQVEGVPRNQVARLNPDGSLDTQFDTGSGPDGQVLAVAIQGDGKIIVCGNFTYLNAKPASGIARLNRDGRIDNAFSARANGTVTAVAVQLDGKIVIAGEFRTVGDVSIARLARLDADCSLDTSFNAGTGPDGPLSSVLLLRDGKLLVAGDFSSIDGVRRVPDSRGSTATVGSTKVLIRPHVSVLSAW